VNPYTGATDPLMVAMADQTGMKALHMLTAGDPARNATFVFFGDPNYFITDFPTSTCETCINPAFAWNHGDIQSEIANTWLGFVGPGVKKVGRTGDVWTDHTDVRPTMLAALGLSDGYESDGRVISEVLKAKADPDSNRPRLEALGAVYKQLNAPFGAFALNVLLASTKALPADDATYARLEAAIASVTARRDALAAEIRTVLHAAAFSCGKLTAKQAKAFTERATQLLDEAVSLNIN
jgi:hypothetical protein